MEDRRINPAWVQAISQILEMTFNDGKKADKAIEFTFSTQKKYGKNDRAFIAECSYEIIRYWRLWHYILGREPLYDKKGLWEVFGVYWLAKGRSLPNWSEFRDIQKMPLTKKLEQAKQFPEILHSYGDELYQRASKQLGDKWLDIAAAMNTPANLILRVNTLKNSKEELIKLLAKEGIEVTESAVAPWALICKQRSNVFQTSLFKEGRFEVQDAGSQLIAEYCNAEPGKFVIDACAGAGGKSLYLAAKMKNKGRIIAMDVEAYKLQELKRRASRAGVHNIQMEVIEGQKSIKKHNNQADILLLDVPCSGSGVLKRNPDAKYKITNSFICKLTEKQKFILQNYSQMLKNGGSLVYATCSILPEENEEQIRNFLNNNGGFELEEERTIYPNEMGFDGFYMARIQKKS